MKTLIKILFVCSAIQILLFSKSHAQDECLVDEFIIENHYPNNFFGGYFKPHRTDLDDGDPSPSNATYNMLFVFVDFPSETTQSGEWPIGQPPGFMDKFLVKDKNGSGDFWNRYKDSSLSDYYQEISRGAFHVTGETRYLTMYNNWSYYVTSGYNVFLTEIYTRLKSDTTINWAKFDQWSRNNSTNNYVFAKDGFLDMIGIFMRHVHGTDFTAAPGYPGYVPLTGPTFTVFANSTDTVKINPTRSEFGSGFVVKGTLGPLGFYRSMGIAIHEYGHYLFANNHSISGIMTSNGGISINDLFMSGFEKYKLGLLDTQTVNYSSQSNYSIGCVSGRSGSPHILRVPITDTDFFIIENRRKISSWDVYMLGDTSQTNPFKNTGDYGKGVYIYHSNNIGINYAGNVDVECADGLWNWDYQGTTTPDWSNEQQISILKKVSIPNPLNNDIGPFNRLNNSDGVSASAWFSLGKRHTQINSLPGIDRIFVNENEWWTSRELWGDRYDAWNLGYNEIFSPYSNPNTKSANNNGSGVFIWYTGLNNDIASFKIYRAIDQSSLDNILELTPPSRPMGLQVDPVGAVVNNYYRFKLTWNHNMEPDMRREDPEKELVEKRYKIYRSIAANMNSVPPDAQFYPENLYTLIATVDIDENETPEFVDTELISEANEPPDGQCPPTCWTMYPVRYRVQAVDMYDDQSVLSDFAQGRAWRIETGGGGKDPGIEQMPHPGEGLAGETPNEFALKQNFPNPFNPTTNIQFDLPRDEFVTIKIYDMSGRELEILFNDFRTAGRYIVGFNASHLASGVYFYTIKAGNFEQTRRMLLIK